MNKKSLLVSIIAILLPAISFAGSWDGWIYQNPYPTSNTLLAVKFITPQKGWIAGEKGTILYTEDGGNSWEAQESGTEQDIKSLAFINDKQGWAVGNGGVIIHTENGGKTWTSQGDVRVSSLNKVFFVSEKEGWIVGNEATVLHTTDAGMHWNKQEIVIMRNIASIHFINPQTGWILAGDDVYRTKDGGRKWEKSAIDVKIQYPQATGGNKYIPILGQKMGPEWWEGDIYFTDEKNGWAVFGLWYISHTVDGGKTWQTNNVSFTVGKIVFSDKDNGCAIGTTALGTDDGGKTWKDRFGHKSAEDAGMAFWGLSYAGQKTWWVVGKIGYGQLYNSEDGGQKWEEKTRYGGSRDGYFFVDDKIGWDFGYDDKFVKSGIIKTEDSGHTWKVQKEFKDGIHIDFFFLNSKTGWIVGEETGRGRDFYKKLLLLNYFILRTDDGGKTWVTQLFKKSGKEFQLSDQLSDIFFINPDIGWAVGDNGLILHTKDGGTHWERQQSGTKSRLRRVQFIDGERGWAVGRKSTKVKGHDYYEYNISILHTDDGGEHWRVQWERKGEWSTMHDLYVIDENNIWAVGDISEYSGDGIIVHSSDGGKTWSESTEDLGGTYLRQLFFMDKNNGVVLTEKGSMLITTDGGKAWSKRRIPVRRHLWHVSELFNKSK